LAGLITGVKPKPPTIEEIQEQKEEELRRKHEKEEDALKRREEHLRKRAEEQREKREERVRRVQEARMQKENQKESNLKKTQVNHPFFLQAVPMLIVCLLYRLTS